MVTKLSASAFVCRSIGRHEAVTGSGAEARKCVVRWMKRAWRVEFYRSAPGFGLVVRQVEYEDRMGDALTVGSAMMANG